MFKRLFWLLVGTVVGFGSSVWVQRKVKATIERFLPQRVSDDLTKALRHLTIDLREAVEEGREAMAKREAELRGELEPHR